MARVKRALILKGCFSDVPRDPNIIEKIPFFFCMRLNPLKLHTLSYGRQNSMHNIIAKCVSCFQLLRRI